MSAWTISYLAVKSSMVKVQRSLLKTAKEQPVMAKQMVKNIQFDLLEKRKEIDMLGLVLKHGRVPD